MKIVILDGYTLNPGDLTWDGFKGLGNVIYYDRTHESQTIERIGDAEIVITNKTVIDQKVIVACPQLKYIGVLATGYNVVAIETAHANGICVTNIPSYGTDAVAQFVFGQILALAHRIESHSMAVHSGQWIDSQDFCFWNSPLVELAGKTIGLVGYGRIGQRVSQIALAFGMKVVVYTANPQKYKAESQVSFVTFEALLKNSDIISLHAPLTPFTHHIIDESALKSMKDGVWLINTSRGPLVDEAALVEALKSGKVGGAALDVISQEPMVETNPLLGCDNVLITPHIAWAPIEARRRLMAYAVKNLEAYMKGEPINTVD